LLRIRPQVEVLATMPQLVAAHNVQTIGKRIFANNTRARCFEIYDADNLAVPAVRVVLDEGAGASAQFATSGWIRGMCWVHPDLIVVGNSPASLVSIDLISGRVVDRLTLSDDVSHAVHGLCSAPA
jgi:hypothetical protein